jgi:hypothetical protein
MGEGSLDVLGDVGGDSATAPRLLFCRVLSRKLLDEARGDGAGRPSLLRGGAPRAEKPLDGELDRPKDPACILCRLRFIIVPNRFSVLSFLCSMIR